MPSPWNATFDRHVSTFQPHSRRKTRGLSTPAIKMGLLKTLYTREHLLTKAECWGYEKEWRILLNLRDCTSKTMLGEDGKEKVVNGLFQVPHEALTSVYLGVNIDPKDQEQFLDLLPPGDRVGLFQFRQDERDYALVAQQIN